MSTFSADLASGDENSWVEAPATQAPELFAVVYARHVTAVYRYSLRILRDAVEAEEITQDVFVLAWTKRTSIRLVDQSLLPWLLVTCRNLSLNRVRQLRKRADRDRQLPSADDSAVLHSAADEDAAARMLHDAIDEAIDSLSSTDQTLFHLCVSEGLSYKQAAAALGTTHAAVRNRLGRLRQNLRTTLTPHREGLS